MNMYEGVFNNYDEKRIPIKLYNLSRYPSKMHNDAIKKHDLKIANNWGPNYNNRKFQQPIITTSKMIEIPVNRTRVL